MSTSLAEQLKKLATPQTSLLIQGKTKPSLLFDPREAANFDRDTFYEIGISGLDELQKLNPEFEQFHRNLFDLSARTVERAVTEKKANKKIDKQIRKFLLLLAPYFLLKSAHKALEWLINRFHIAEYNVDDLMALILPYHDTRIFVRVLQIMDLSDPANKWHWLHPLQSPGVPLSKIVLLNRCASDGFFRKFINQMVKDAIKEHKGNANFLSTLFAFYCTTMVGGLKHTHRITENHVTQVLESVLPGLTSHIVDYAASSFVIVAQLSLSTKLNQHIFENIVYKVAKCSHEKLHMECVLLLVLLYNSQADKASTLPMSSRTLKKLAVHDWFPNSLGKLHQAGVDLIPLYISLIHETFAAINSEIEIDQLCSFSRMLLNEIQLDVDNAVKLISIVIEAFDPERLSKRTSAAGEESEMIGVDNSEDILSFYSTFLQLLERRYATAYDTVIHKTLIEGGKPAKSLRKLLGMAKGGNVPLGATDLFEKIYHPNATMREEAVKYLVKHCDHLEERDRDLLGSALSARLRDECPKVVKAALGLPTNVLIDILTTDVALEELLYLMEQWLENKDKRWLQVAQAAVPHLCSDKLSDISPAVHVRIILALLPCLLIVNEKEVNLLLAVLQQEHFIGTSKLLTAICEDIKEKNPELSDIAPAIFRCIFENKELLPDLNTLMELGQNMPKGEYKPIHQILLVLILVSALPKSPDPGMSLKVLDLIISLVGNSKIIISTGELKEDNTEVMINFVMIARGGHFPLEIFLYCIMQLINGIPLEENKDRMWWNLEESTPALSLRLRLLEVLLIGCSLEDKDARLKYTSCLKSFFKIQLATPDLQVNFLCNIAACSQANHGEIAWPEMRLRCLRLLLAILLQSKPLSRMIQLCKPVVPALLVAAFSSLAAVRQVALECLITLSSSLTASITENTYIQLLEEIKDRREEIMLDAEQLPLVLYTVLSPDPAVKSLLQASRIQPLASILSALLDCVTCVETPYYIVSALMDMLLPVNTTKIVLRLIPQGRRVLSTTKDSMELDAHSSAIVRNIFKRINHETADCLKNVECWNFVESALMDWKTTLLEANGPNKTNPSQLILLQVSRELFEALDEPLQLKLMHLILKVASDCEEPKVTATAARVVKKLVLDGKQVAVFLGRMSDEHLKQAQLQHPTITRRKVKAIAPSLELLQTPEWRYGITLLEWLQAKKKLTSSEFLLSPLFSVLARCLEFEEQSPVEYTKQLLLCCLLHCCQKLSPNGSPVDGAEMRAFNVELIVQCIRASQNPQTHHFALLLLAHIAGMIPEQVLHNIMAIFTFIGSSVLRQDDAYSFQIISKVIDTVIPILVKASEGVVGTDGSLDHALCSVLRVFADAVLDIPEHRRLPLFQRLLNNVGPQKGLWLFVCLVLETHVTQPQQEQTRRDKGEMPHRLEFLMTLMLCFSPHVVISTCNRVIEYIQTLPLEKDERVKKHLQKTSAVVGVGLLQGLFDPEHHTAKQLRHFKYTASTFLLSLLSSSQFVNQVAELSDEDTYKLTSPYRSIIETLLMYVQTVSRQADASAGKATAKYWNIMRNQAYDILDKVNALLPSEMFLVVVRELLKHEILPVQQKALDLLNSRLQVQSSVLTTCKQESLYDVLELLVNTVKDAGQVPTTSERELNQQSALLSIKLLARMLAAENPQYFKKVLDQVASLMQRDTVKGNLLASVVLCVAELVSTLRAHAIASLSFFVPALIAVLHDQKKTESPDLLLLSVVTAVQKVVECLPNFLSPYLDKLLYELCIQSVKWQPLSDNTKVAPILHKLKTVRQKLASSIAGRILIPSVGRCYKRILKKKKFSALGPLLTTLADNFSSMESSELTQLMQELTAFFTEALQFRADNVDTGISDKDIMESEGHVVAALVALVLKLSEATFRPLYYSLFHWATSLEDYEYRAITFYRLSSSIADSLKGLYVLFAGRLVQNASNFLSRLNVMKIEKDKTGGGLLFGLGPEAEANAQLLLQYVLETLHKVFKYDNGQGFVNKERFDILMQPLMDQLENTLGGVDVFHSRVTSLLCPTIVEFTVAVGDDFLWKQLNYQLLLKTRHDMPQVRLAALNVLCEMVRKLGESFLPLLPETVPFLAELLEDEEESVESSCQKTVQELEEILGEPLKKYF